MARRRHGDITQRQRIEAGAHDKPLALAVSMISLYDRSVKEHTKKFSRSLGSTAGKSDHARKLCGASNQMARFSASLSAVKPISGSSSSSASR